MRLIDAEMIKIPTSLIHNINGCFMIRVEDVQRITSDQPTAFDKEKVIEKLKCLEVNAFGYYSQYDDEQAFGESAAYRAAIEIIEKGGIE